MNQPVRPIREGFVRPDEAQQPASPNATTEPPTIEAEQPAAAAAPVVETWPIKVKLLHRPISGNRNETLNELSFREPTGGDINRVGNPVHIDASGEVMIDERKMTNMIGALSGVLTTFLERMDPRDWNSCAYRLRRFFVPDPEAW